MAISTPVTGCTITAGTVKRKSASTTWRAVTAIAGKSPERSARHMKKAVPSPVPKSTVALRIWINFSQVK